MTQFTTEEILEKVKKIMSDNLSVAEEEITIDSTFDELGCDSLDQVQISVDFEKAFNIHILDEDLEKIKTVRDAIKCIQSELKK